ncbi:sorbosone dehydrogenase family protein [Persicitalea sp.]|uniref:PQQ-dependent sugar dehydrogenase n=1 Tax=Persicitalea sp. TaxID=3100273 RepID=UPI0035941DD7
MRSLYTTLLLILTASLLASAQTLPAGFTKETLASGIARPTVMAFAPDGRLFVCEQNGKIKIFKNGAILTTSYAQLTVDGSGERGLLGIDFDPNFSSNGYVYVYYTRTSSPRRNRVARLTSDPANPDLMLAGSETLVLEFNDLSSATNHNGGFIQFGTDGKLYVSIGDNANTANSQNYDTYLGNFLRINADGSAPTDNPFYSTTPDGSPPTPASQRTWAIGLRNPYSFDVNFNTGKIFVNDVGGNQYEEVNDATAAGQNFGWPTQEGPPEAGFDGPAYYYQNNNIGGSTNNTGCSVLGGEFFVPASTNYPSQYLGKYFFMDYCNGWIRYIDPASTPTTTSTLFGDNFGFGLVNMTTGPDGNLYYLNRNQTLNRIVYTPPLIESVASGNWNDAATWSCACVPTPSDRVSIKAGHNVSVDGIRALAYEVSMDGGEVEVKNSGTLQLNH